MIGDATMPTTAFSGGRRSLPLRRRGVLSSLVWGCARSTADRLKRPTSSPVRFVSLSAAPNRRGSFGDPGARTTRGIYGADRCVPPVTSRLSLIRRRMSSKQNVQFRCVDFRPQRSVHRSSRPRIAVRSGIVPSDRPASPDVIRSFFDLIGRFRACYCSRPDRTADRCDRSCTAENIRAGL